MGPATTKNILNNQPNPNRRHTIDKGPVFVMDVAILNMAAQTQRRSLWFIAAGVNALTQPFSYAFLINDG